MTDTAQMKMALRTNPVARSVRAKFGEGTRVVSAAGGMGGLVTRHVPMTNGQGGVLVIDWDAGHSGRTSPCDVRREDADV